MLRALTAGGVRPEFVAGSSVGAINAAYFAADPTPEGVVRLEAIWRAIRGRDVFPVSAAGVLLRLLARQDHLLTQTALRHLLEGHLPYQRLEEARIPCHVVATDLLAGTEVRVATGSVVEALLAATAIPGVFPPMRVAGRFLVDGGVTSNTPIAAAVALGAQRVLVLPTGIACALETPPRGMIAVALHAIGLLIARQLVSDVERFKDQAEVIVVPPLCPLAVSSYDFSHSGELIERAAQSTAQWLDRRGLQDQEIPVALHPHHHRS